MLISTSLLTCIIVLYTWYSYCVWHVPVCRVAWLEQDLVDIEALENTREELMDLKEKLLEGMSDELKDCIAGRYRSVVVLKLAICMLYYILVRLWSLFAVWCVCVYGMCVGTRSWQIGGNYGRRGSHSSSIRRGSKSGASRIGEEEDSIYGSEAGASDHWWGLHYIGDVLEGFGGIREI